MKRFALLTILCFAFTACYSQRMISDTFTYTEGVTCTVKGFSTMKMFRAMPGDGVTYAAKSGHKLVKMQLVVKNVTKETQPLELSEFEIVDSKGKRYMACLAIQNLVVNDEQYLSRELKPGKERTFQVLYCEDFPEDDMPVSLMVKDVMIPLYEKK